VSSKLSSTAFFDHLKRHRVGFAVLTTALLVGGCGTRASDAEIAEALRGAPVAASVADTAESAPGSAAAAPAATTVPQTTASASDAATTPLAGTTGGAVTPKAAAPGAKVEATSATAPRVANKSEVRIGQLGPWSGVFGAATAPAPKALAAWVAWKNATGGLNGHPIKLIVADDQADPGTSLTLAKRLVESDKIIAMVGNINIFGFPGLEKYMREKNVPMIGGDGIDKGWFATPIGFPIAPPAEVQIIKGLKMMIEQKGAKKIGIFYCLEVSAICSYLVEQVKKDPEVGPKTTETYQVSLVAPSYTSQCLRLKSAGVDTLYLLMDGAGAARAAQDCARQGYKPQIMLLSLDATAELPGVAALSTALVPGATFAPAPGQGVPAIDQYFKILATYAPSLGHAGMTSLGWAAGELFGLAGRNLPDKPAPADLFSALWQLKNETLGGLTVPMTFPKGGSAQLKPCVFLWGTGGGKFTAPSGAKPVC
jgi:branched-chain amino acid transport system substrate-binding protein